MSENLPAATQAEAPDDMMVRVGILSVNPLILLGTLDYSREKRNFTNPRLRRILGDRPAHFFGVLPWSHEKPTRVAEIVEAAREQAADFPHQTVHVLCNTQAEAELFAARGMKASLVNHNIFIDHGLFRPLPATQRRFDAIYVAAMEPFKRHHLMCELRSAVLAYGRWGRGDPARDAYYEEIRALLRNCHFANQPEESGQHKYLSASQVAELCNQAHVGLCLSDAEGAMRASMEYLLCGLPVVSTPNVGGRDLFFDPAYAITVEPEPSAIVHAVDALIARRLPPQQVREAVLRKVRPMRQTFVGLLREIYAGEERPWPPIGYFRDPFRHPYEDILKICDFPKRLAAAEAAHQQALTIDVAPSQNIVKAAG